MAQLVGLIVSQDDAFRKQIGHQLRSGAMPISVMDDRTARDGVLADIIIVDVRGRHRGAWRPSSCCARARRQRDCLPLRPPRIRA